MRFDEANLSPFLSDDEGTSGEVVSTEAETPEEVKTYTEEEVQAMIAEASNKAVQERLARERKKLSAEKDKAVAEAEKLAKMTASEKIEHELAKAQAELTELRAEKAKAEMTQIAKQMLSADGLSNVPDAIVSLLIGDDAEATSEAVKAFSATYQMAVQEGIRDALKGSTPKKGGGATLTKDEILSIPDTSKRLQAIRENFELFKQ